MPIISQNRVTDNANNSIRQTRQWLRDRCKAYLDNMSICDITFQKKNNKYGLTYVPERSKENFIHYIVNLTLKYHWRRAVLTVFFGAWGYVPSVVYADIVWTPGSITPATPVGAAVGGWRDIVWNRVPDRAPAGESSSGCMGSSGTYNGSCARWGIGPLSPGSGSWVKASALYQGNGIVTTSELSPCGLGIAFSANGTSWVNTTGNSYSGNSVNPDIDVQVLISGNGLVSRSTVRIGLIKFAANTQSTCTVKAPIQISVGGSGSYQQFGSANLYGIDVSKRHWGNATAMIAPGTFTVSSRTGCTIAASKTFFQLPVISAGDVTGSAGKLLAMGDPTDVTLNCTGGSGAITAGLSIDWSVSSAYVGTNTGSQSSTDAIGIGFLPSLSSPAIGSTLTGADFIGGSSGKSASVELGSKTSLRPAMIFTGESLTRFGEYNVDGTITSEIY